MPVLLTRQVEIYVGVEIEKTMPVLLSRQDVGVENEMVHDGVLVLWAS